MKKRKQLNIRVNDRMEGTMAELLPAMRTATGIHLSLSDIVTAGLDALARIYVPGYSARNPTPAPQLTEMPAIHAARRGRKPKTPPANGQPSQPRRRGRPRKEPQQ